MQLVSTSKLAATTQAFSMHGVESDWNNFTLDVNSAHRDDSTSDQSSSMLLLALDSQGPDQSLPGDGTFSHELISLGLQEPLPPIEMVEAL
jgi:hypothetical protein